MFPCPAPCPSSKQLDCWMGPGSQNHAVKEQPGWEPTHSVCIWWTLGSHPCPRGALLCRVEDAFFSVLVVLIPACLCQWLDLQAELCSEQTARMG